MVTLEQVEKLREKAGISYEEARKALEETDGDLLQAVINLEKRGLINPPESGGYYTSRTERQEQSNGGRNNGGTGYQEHQSDSGKTHFSELIGNFFRWCGKVIRMANRNSFEVVKDGHTIMLMPLTVFVLLLIFAFWIVVPVIVIGLVFGFRYRFVGPDLNKTQINKSVETVSDATLQAINKVVDAAENLSRDILKNKGEKTDGEDTHH